MPTGREQANPRGLQEAVSESVRSFQELSSEVTSSGEALTRSEDLARRLDQAVMEENAGSVVQLLQESGVSEETRLTAEEMEADRKLVIRWHGPRLDFCFEWEW